MANKGLQLWTLIAITLCNFLYIRHWCVKHAKMTSSKHLNQHGTTCYTTLKPYYWC